MYRDIGATWGFRERNMPAIGVPRNILGKENGT